MHGRLVRYWAAEGQFFCHEGYQIEHELKALTPRARVNRGQPKQRALAEFSKVKLGYFRESKPNAVVPDDYKFDSRPDRTGDPQPTDFVLGQPVWN